MTVLNSLEEIRRTLNLALGNEALFSLVNTRVMLKTGVDLSRFEPTENLEPGRVEKVLSALQAMGYSKSALLLVTQRKA